MHTISNRIARLLAFFCWAALAVGCGGQATYRDMPAAQIAATGGVAASMAAPVLGVTIDRKLKVLGVEAGSPAERAGVQRGDTLDALDGITLAAPDGLAKAKQRMGSARIGQRLPLKLERGGQKLELTVTAAPTVGRPGPATPTPVGAADYYF